MDGMTETHPDAVLEALLAKGGRSQRRANLVNIHDLCRGQHETGSRDFSVSTVGRLIEANGIMKGRALYNAQSADYRALIEAWAAYSGPLVSRAPKAPKVLASHEYLMRIDDPAIRSIMQAAIAERDKLKAQVNVLKSKTQVIVDRRPLGAGVSVANREKTVTVVSTRSQLTTSERDALRKAISPDYLEDRGLREGSHGEILNERGRTIFEVGFARAIRKLLDD